MKSKSLPFLFLVAMLVTGCWDRKEINDVAIVLTSAFDKAEENKIRHSFLVALPGQMGGTSGGGGGTGGGEPFYIESETGENIREIATKVQKRMARTINLTHRRVIIIGEELAKEGIKGLFDGFSRVPQNRVTAYLVVARGEGKKLIEAQPNLERFSGEAIREIVNLGAVGETSMKDVANKLSLPGIDPIIPVFEVVPKKNKKAELEAVGLGIFSGDKLVKILEEEDIQAGLLLAGQFRAHGQSFDVGGKRVTINIQDGRMKLEVKSLGERLHYNIKLEMEGEVLEDRSPEDLFERENLNQIEASWKEILKKDLEKNISLLQQLQADILGAGAELKRTYPNEWRRRRDNWYGEFAKSQFTYDIDVTLRRIGQVSENVAERIRVVD